MKKIYYLILLCFLSINVSLFANDYQKAWEALSKGNITEAEALFTKAAQDPQYKTDASIALILLRSYNGQGAMVRDYWEQVYKSEEDPYSYLFALWFNKALLGEYGMKDKQALSMLQKIESDKKAPGSLPSTAYYMEGYHYLLSNDFKKAFPTFKKMGAIDQWQFVGPFENIMGSGFDKAYPPISKPKKEEVFQSTDNAPISWFQPKEQSKEQWVHAHRHFNESNGILYAQTFVYSETAQDVILCVGATGNIKVWVNDIEAINESEERITELDSYKRRCSLNKGYNRILVQLGFFDYNSPNYIVRLTDEQFNAIPTLSWTASYQDYQKGTANTVKEAIPHFAEQFFLKKIEENPENPLNYILLSNAYLRNTKVDLAKETINKGLKLHPENLLLHAVLVVCYGKSENRTELLKELDWLKKKTPDSYVTLTLLLEEQIREEKYKEAELTLEKVIRLFGESPKMFYYKIQLARALSRVEDMFKLITEGYQKYPEDSDYTILQYSVEKEVNKNPQKAIKVLESYLKKTYNYKITSALISDYLEQGQNDKALKLLTKYYEYFPYETTFSSQLAQYYYLTRNASKSIEYMERAIDVCPFDYSLWETKALIYEQIGEKKLALEALQKSLSYNPNQYDLRRKIADLDNKSTAENYLYQGDEYKEIANSEADEEKKKHDFYYIFNKQSTVLYAEGAREEHYSLAIRVLNEYGRDSWKEVSIPYHYRQRLVIEKAEVIKKNGQKVAAERNRNDIVFTDLAIGDAIYIKYKLENFFYSKASLYTWDQFHFNNTVPVDYACYTLLADPKIKVDHQILNSDFAPKIDKTSQNEFVTYQWEMTDLEALEQEPLMPMNSDISISMHFSTAAEWTTISDWYNSMSLPQAKMNYELYELLKELFPNGHKTLSEEEKARTIYSYITKNISYSSIPFRQSAWVPQKAAKTLHTKLGDCKDVATLFVTLAREVGLKANLVLINTRNNGEKDVVVPSLGFNHCIVKVNLDAKEQYLELTSSNLPFGSLPPTLIDAAILEIPTDGSKSELTFMKNPNKTADMIIRRQQIKVEGTNLIVNRKSTKVGAGTAGMRADYAMVDHKRQKEYMENAVSKDFKNGIIFHDVEFLDLDSISDSLNYNYDFTVKNEIIEIGNLKTLKIPFVDVVVTPAPFSKEERIYSVEYLSYEVIDTYDEEIVIEVPENNEFTDIPDNIEITELGFKYSLKFTKLANNKLKIQRVFLPVRRVFSKEEYSKLRTFLNLVLAAESKYIAYK